MLESPSPELESVIPKSLCSAKIELIDLRSILPWDVNTIAESVNRTGRLVIVHEAGITAGVGAEISAEIQKRCFLKLNAPVKRVGAWEYVCFSHRSTTSSYTFHSLPNALHYEKFHVPDAIRVLDAIVETLTY